MTRSVIVEISDANKLKLGANHPMILNDIVNSYINVPHGFRCMIMVDVQDKQDFIQVVGTCALCDSGEGCGRKYARMVAKANPTTYMNGSKLILPPSVERTNA